MLKVACCWDDGVSTDIRLISILRKYGAKATFNICPGRIPDHTEPAEWRKPGEKGWFHLGFRAGIIGKDIFSSVYRDFPVASHCWHHEQAGKMPDEQFMEAAISARKFLEETFDRECRGFAWPGGAYTPETCKLMREAGFLYGRTCEYTDDITRTSDPMALASNTHFQAWDFWNKYEAAKKGSGVFYFWGHTYETLNYEMLWADLEGKIRYISEDPDAKWINVSDLPALCCTDKKRKGCEIF